MTILKRVLIPQGYVGIKYANLKFSEILPPGVYYLTSLTQKLLVKLIPTNEFIEQVSNQLITTSDNQEIKVSLNIKARIEDPEKYANKYTLLSLTDSQEAPKTLTINQDLHLEAQTSLRKVVASMTFEEVLADKEKIEQSITNQLQEYFGKKGVEVQAVIRDLTPSKTIRDLYQAGFTVEKRAKIALEEARAQIASARALANAAKILNDNPNIKFLKLLETLERISQKQGNSLHVHLGENDK